MSNSLLHTIMQPDSMEGETDLTVRLRLSVFFIKDNIKNMKINYLAASVALAAFVSLNGCSTMFSGNHQKVQVRTHNDVVDTKLDNVAKFDVLVDKDRLLYQNVGAGETIDIHRTATPVSVKVIESECILPTEEKFDSSVHPLVLLDVLMTSLLSTSIDSSTGAMWRYDETLHVTPKIKDTPECRKWLEEQVGKMDPHVLSKPITRGPLYDSENKFPTDPDAVVHPKGFENGFSKK